jgi:hypothetical protein
MSKLRRTIISKSNFRSINLSPDATQYLEERLKDMENGFALELLEEILKKTQEKIGNSRRYTKDDLKETYIEIINKEDIGIISDQEEETEPTEEELNISPHKFISFLQIKDFPKNVYNRGRKTYEKSTEEINYFGNPEDKPNIYRLKYETIFQKCSRDNEYSKKLTTIQTLIGINNE